jgi:U6 snRNA-associated Sm-like protein LSm3
MEASQPLLLLQTCLECDVQVYAKGLKTIVGRLNAFDQHLNIVLSNAKEFDQLNNSTRAFEVLFVRGDSIILVCNDSSS